MAINLTDSIRVGQQKPIDDKYYNELQPYVDEVEVCSLLPSSLRYRGLTVNISGDEYWFKEGILDTDLILKESGGGIESVTGDLVDNSDPSNPIVNTPDLSDYIKEPTTDGTSGQVLTTDGSGGRSWTTVSGGGVVEWGNISGDQSDVNLSGFTNDSGFTTNEGTVKSVSLSAPTGFDISGSPVTTTGTLAFDYSSGYQPYTTTEANKLSGIEAGAEVNVNADWNSSSGDSQILNKPTIPTKTSDLINEGADNTSTYVEFDDLAPVATSNDYNDLDNLPSLDFLQSVVAGNNISVDNSDPKNPVINSTGGSETFDSNVTFVLESGSSFGKYRNGDTASWVGLTPKQAILDAAIDFLQPVNPSLGTPTFTKTNSGLSSGWSVENGEEITAVTVTFNNNSNGSASAPTISGIQRNGVSYTSGDTITPAITSSSASGLRTFRAFKQYAEAQVSPNPVYGSNQVINFINPSFFGAGIPLDVEDSETVAEFMTHLTVSPNTGGKKVLNSSIGAFNGRSITTATSGNQAYLLTTATLTSLSQGGAPQSFTLVKTFNLTLIDGVTEVSYKLYRLASVLGVGEYLNYQFS